jgi:hypothetical protein
LTVVAPSTLSLQFSPTKPSEFRVVPIDVGEWGVADVAE